MTQEEWDNKWWELYNAFVRGGLSPGASFERAHKYMQRHHGFRPKGESSGPPFWVKLSAPFIGVPVDKLKAIWDWLNGKKLFIVSLVAGIPVIWEAVRSVICAASGGTCPASVVQIGLVLATVLAVVHRILKLLGWAETTPSQ
jgi:hypothetical protein